MSSYGFEFKGRTSQALGAYFSEYPVITKGTLIMTSETVPGRAGAVTTSDGTYKDTIINCVLEVEYIDSLQWEQKYREMYMWLSGQGELSFSDDPDYYYRVKHVELTGRIRLYGLFGSFTVTFICEPGIYTKAGKQAITNYSTLINPLSISEPTYNIKANKLCTLTVNGKSMKINVGQNVVIDTERKQTRKEDGTPINTSVVGNYEDLYLKPGQNKISITTGVVLEIIPHWRVL